MLEWSLLEHERIYIYTHIAYIIADIILFAQHNGIQERVFKDDTSNYSRIGPEHEHTVDETKP